MNAGLGNLTSLKAQLLAVSMQSQTNYDPIITAIGLGVAKQIDKFLNRTMMRMVGKVDTFRADRRHWYLNAYPVEAITATAKKDSEADGYVAFPLPPNGSALILMMDLPARLDRICRHPGLLFQSNTDHLHRRLLVEPGGSIGRGLHRVAGTAAGSFALDADIQLAWFLACKNVWKRFDPLGVQISQDPEPQSAMADLKLPHAAKELLQGHIRYNIS